MFRFTSRLPAWRWRHTVPFLPELSTDNRLLQHTIEQPISDWTVVCSPVAKRRTQSVAELKREGRGMPTRPSGHETAESKHTTNRSGMVTYNDLGRQLRGTEESKGKEKLKTPTAASKWAFPRKWKGVRVMASAKDFKRLVKDYGWVALAFHSTVFLSTLGGMYFVVDYGVDVQSFVKHIPLIAEALPHPSAGNLAVAWGLTAFTGPGRAVLTITLTPRLARFWWGREAKRKIGHIDAQSKQSAENTSKTDE